MPLLLLLLALLSAALPARAQDEPASVPAGYQLGARDVVRVEVFEEEGLSGDFEVSDDGTIDLPLVGRMLVSGLSLSDFDLQLTGRLGKDYLVAPQVTVQITRFGSKAVRILGAVKQPGVYPLSGPTSVLELIALAGGMGADGVSEVRISRKGVVDTLVLRLDEVALDETSWMLIEGDSVFVPPPKVVYVAGQVLKPGAVPFGEGLTISQAIILAGGAKTGANLRRVWIKRGDAPIRVNLKRVSQGRAEDVLLRPDDQIMVAESVL